MEVEFLYTPGCATEESGRSLLASVLEEMGLPPDFEAVPVATPEAAVALAFPGSPTFRIDGRDADPAVAAALAAGTAPVGLG
jgi:hypothetical protein